MSLKMRASPVILTSVFGTKCGTSVRVHPGDQGLLSICAGSSSQRSSPYGLHPKAARNVGCRQREPAGWRSDARWRSGSAACARLLRAKRLARSWVAVLKQAGPAYGALRCCVRASGGDCVPLLPPPDAQPAHPKGRAGATLILERRCRAPCAARGLLSAGLVPCWHLDVPHHAPVVLLRRGRRQLCARFFPGCPCFRLSWKSALVFSVLHVCGILSCAVAHGS